jgi:hypothetical protein
MCQRYYEQSPSLSNFVNSRSVVAFNTTYANGLAYLVRKRASPTVVLYSRNGTANSISTVNSGADITGTATINAGCSDSFHLVQSNSNTLTGGQGYDVIYTANAEL